MKIQILGSGCSRCQTLLANTEQAVAELGIEAEVVKITEIKDIMAFGVMQTPALAIDGVVKSAGRLLSPEQVKKLLS